MIEILNAARCTSCDICVRICPTNVFEPAADGGVPTIARHSDCQTCFQCEAYCPEDAIFVSPSRTPEPAGSPFLDEADLLDRDLLGLYRDRVGWRRTSRRQDDTGDARTTGAATRDGAPGEVLASDVDYHRAAALAPATAPLDRTSDDRASLDRTPPDSTTNPLQGAPS
ncbi:MULTISPECIES: 4Fe-4S dicluster domain-containing protein [Oerskovia]|uniref:Ferredoxin family protein n=1 Tax=Oerskovia rustica TaxID=2762237 RepID=A0ABR8RSK4_9CELL|nr:ferredoxin family protein [Oerskovia rustica]MBD7950784.1 ferredoxin family protein [Oerskovia rustica]